MRAIAILPLLLVAVLASAAPREHYDLPPFVDVSARTSWSGLVNDYIGKKPTVSTLEICGSWVACTTVVVNTTGQCESEPASSLYLTTLTLRLYGTIHYFNGPFYSRKRPTDRRVVNSSTAISHEYDRHIVPAVDAVVPLIERIRAARFASPLECEAASGDAAESILTTFRTVLARTQKDEEEGRVY